MLHNHDKEKIYHGSLKRETKIKDHTSVKINDDTITTYARKKKIAI